MNLLHRMAVEALVGLACFCVVGPLLWRLRSWGYWTASIGIGIMILMTSVFTVLTHEGAGSPVAGGLVVGCGLPTAFMFAYQLVKGKMRG